jgi:thiamine biosynthesis lipoprotein
MLTRQFHAMGTQVEIFLEADEDAGPLLDEAASEFERLEALLSRFRPDSELSRLNAEGSLVAGPELLELVRLSLDARERTNGRFDPTVHDALVAAGYDRTFEEVEREHDSPSPGAGSCAGEVHVDGTSHVVSLAPGTRIDLGGIAKGWAADRVLELLSQAGPALVNAGGDVACSGRPWHVGLEAPAGPITLELERGGLATSGRDRRRWSRGGVEAHHLIDPSTGAPARTGLVTATVVAPSAADAEVLATSLFLAGDPDRAAAEADAEGVAALLVGDDGRTLLAGGLS